MPLTYDEACKLIYDLPKFTTKHTPQESRTFLEALGSPEQGIRILHVAGTNGKGSVCAYMESILMHAGFHTGCFISPHLVDMCERVRIDSADCSKEDFAWAAGIVNEMARKLYYPTFFEYLFFMGLLIFKKNNVDIAILETGLGGRLDATNLPVQKELAIITSIGMDHMEYLGNTVQDIAGEKAGIMRKEVPVVYWKDEPDTREQEFVYKTLHNCSKTMESVEYALSRSVVSNVFVDNYSIDFDLRYGYDIDTRLSVSSRGLYQIYNAALAVCALSIWDVDHLLKEGDYVHGIANMKWAGRMEEIFPHIYLDGAHNVPAMRELVRTAAEDGADCRMLVFGCMRDKQYLEEIDIILKSNLFDRIEVADIESDRAMAASELATIIGGRVNELSSEDGGMLIPRIVCADKSLKDELYTVIQDCREYTKQKNAYAYIVGSLYLVGEVRGYINDRF